MSLPPALLLTLDPPLDPSGDEARSLLRRELLRPEYHDEDLVQRLLTWLQRQVERGLAAASQAPPLSTFVAMVVGLLLVAALVWLGTRARLAGAREGTPGAVLPTDTVSAAEWRARARAALEDGRHEEALVDGFRGLAVGQVERGRLDDLPGATAHEVADALGTSYLHQRPRITEAARLFDLVLYGDRPATREQAADVLGLDDELAALR